MLPARYCNACGSLLPTLPPPAPPSELERTQPGGHPVLEPPPPPPSAAEADAPVASVPAPAPGTRPPGLGSPPGVRPQHPAGAAAAAASHPPAPVARPVRPAPPRADTFRRDRDDVGERLEPARFLPASFGERLAAGLVDASLVSAGQFLLVSPILLYWWSRELPVSADEVPFLPIVLSLTLALLAALLGAVYFIYGWGVRGTTPGKRLLGLAVEGAGGRFPIGASAATVRLLGCFVSGLVLGIGFLMIAFQGQGLHDRMAGTRVVRRDRS
jgi:uncharacterized RDD family membrane protein YckC